MNRFFIIVFFSLWVGACSPINRQCVAICGGKQVRIINMERSNGKDVREVWQWDITEPIEGLPEDG